MSEKVKVYKYNPSENKLIEESDQSDQSDQSNYSDIPSQYVLGMLVKMIHTNRNDIFLKIKEDDDKQEFALNGEQNIIVGGRKEKKDKEKGTLAHLLQQSNLMIRKLVNIIQQPNAMHVK